MIPYGTSRPMIGTMLILLYLGFVVGVDAGVAAYNDHTYHETKLEIETDLHDAEQAVAGIDNRFVRSAVMSMIKSMTNVVQVGFEFGYAWPFISLPIAITPMIGIIYVSYRRLVSWIS